MPNRLIPLLTAVCVVALAACETSGRAAQGPLPTPSAYRALCGVRDRAFDLVGRVRAGTITSGPDAADRLRKLADRLDREARRLDSQGFTAPARRARNLATALNELIEAVQSADASRVESAAATAANSTQSIRGCATPSPTPPS
jgi:hypothetical protein